MQFYILFFYVGHTLFTLLLIISKTKRKRFLDI